MNARPDTDGSSGVTPAVPRRILFTAVRNEAAFLLEWIAYHKVIGFDLIVLASNDCDDGTAELADALAAAGEIVHVPHEVPVRARPQGNAARVVNEMGIIADGDWVLWLDADEFLNIHVGDGTLDDLIAAVEPNDGALINWRIFGDGGNAIFPGRFISDAFTGAARLDFAGNAEIKTLFRKGPGIAGFAEKGIHRPRLDPNGIANTGPLRFLAPSGGPVDPANRFHSAWFAGAETSRQSIVPGSERGYSLAQINHYTVRTRDMFDLKRLRGRGWARRRETDDNDRHTDRFYEEHNRNDVEERTILRFEAAVTEQIDTLLSHPEIRAADGMAQERTRAALARLAARDSDDATPVAFPAEVRSEPKVFDLTLPDVAAAALRDAYSGARVILEYGSGGSSFEAMELGAEKLFTVESDATWAASIEESLRARFPERGIHVHAVDIGATKAWGRPKGPEGFAGYPLYPTSVWDLEAFEQPDVVLIDGRFRVACFLTVMMRITKPVTVLFDDYGKRREYHWVETFFEPVARADRMAIFEVAPTPLSPQHLTRIAQAFVDPR